MKHLISLLTTIVMAVSAMMTTSGTIKTSADADAFSAATEKTTYTIQDVRNLQGFILAKPVEEDLTGNSLMIEGIADATFILNGGYKVLDHAEVIQVLKASMG